jgi:hypothetical protein
LAAIHTPNEDKQNNKVDAGMQYVGTRRSWTSKESVEILPTPKGFGKRQPCVILHNSCDDDDDDDDEYIFERQRNPSPSTSLLS